RAMPGSKIGKKIALVEEITRADVAALFIEELKVDEIFKKRVPKKFDTVFKSPEKQLETETSVKILPATDIDDHVLKADIDAVIEIGIKGLQPFPDHTYKPYQTITRAEFAMMIEDILIKLTGVDDLATRFIGGVSPFPDLRNDLPYFNAVMICTTRGIMVAKDLATGEFDAIGPVSGADALLSIRLLKSQL
ncbi:MAG: S-layer homology domain-containing protein, partial [Proteobacteria bacterium]|nr:S-layer homology domain-containing protein [Pseudomonadota bacterium]